MHLNADIVFDNLPAELGASMAGPKSPDLLLERPILYEGGDATLMANRLYVTTANRLSQRAAVEQGCVIVSIGDSLSLDRYRKRCCVITVRQDADFYRTFNVLQKIFDTYDSWEHDLARIVANQGEIRLLLDRGEEVFGNPLYALDKSFGLLGASRMARSMDLGSSFTPTGGGFLNIEAFDQFISLHELSMGEREPLALTLLDQSTLSYNLIDSDEYLGSLTVHYVNRAYRQSDKPLIAVLGDTLLRAMRQLSLRSPEQPGSLRNAVQNLVEERPLDALERDVIESANNGRRFLCLRLKLSNQLEQLPLGYVRTAVEAAFPRSLVFEYHRNSVVAIVDASVLGTDDARSAVAKGVEPFSGAMEMNVGVSNPYCDLASTRSLFEQADHALDVGMLFDPGAHLYFFDDYALRAMVMNAVGSTQLELLCPEGLRRLAEHDESSPTSYLETLRTYLDCNMSVGKTADALYVHRSTLMERLGRIRRELDIDLNDPDERLKLRLLLKAMQTRDELRAARGADLAEE